MRVAAEGIQKFIDRCEPLVGKSTANLLSLAYQTLQ